MPSGLVLLIFAMAFLSLCSLVGSARYGFADGTFGVNHLAWRTRANA
jgi:hypothetical protein